jgi:hypothetical protein
MCSNETYIKVCIHKHLSDAFPINDGLKQGDTLSPLLFKFPLEYAIREVPKKERRLGTECDTSASGLH